MKEEDAAWTVSMMLLLGALVIAGAMCAGCATGQGSGVKVGFPGVGEVGFDTQRAPDRNVGSQVTISDLKVYGPAAEIFAARWGQGIDDLGFLAGADRLRALEEENERLARLIEARLAAEEREADDAEVVE